VYLTAKIANIHNDFVSNTVKRSMVSVHNNQTVSSYPSIYYKLLCGPAFAVYLKAWLCKCNKFQNNFFKTNTDIQLTHSGVTGRRRGKRWACPLVTACWRWLLFWWSPNSHLQQMHRKEQI